MAGPDCARDDLPQSEMNECALAVFNEADARLNAQWKRTFRAFQENSPEDAERLRAAQRAWIAYRDAECDAEHPWDLGVSMDKMLNIFCRTGMTSDRTAKLLELEQNFQ
ncbi:MAG: lysozyme inhibitor LprI family protein [Pseudomonadota bacterium]